MGMHVPSQIFLAASNSVLYYGNARNEMRMNTGEKEAQ